MKKKILRLAEAKHISQRESRLATVVKMKKPICYVQESKCMCETERFCWFLLCA